MKLPTGLLSAVSAGKTFALNFWPWLAAAAVLGAGIGAYGSFQVTRALYRGEALAAKLQLSKFETSLADARAENLQLSQNLANLILEKTDVEKTRLNGIAADVRELGQRVQLCAQKSDVRVTVSPTGAITTVSDGQLRNLAESVREFAEACAHQRDLDATDHNALIDWLEGMRKKK